MITIEKTQYPNKLPVNHAIIDVEIKNNIAPNWNYENGQICIIGILNTEGITQITLHNTTPQDNTKIHNEIMQHTHLWAFNWQMEHGTLKNQLQQEIYFNEIKPFKGKGWTKDKFYNILKKHGLLTCQEPNDPIQAKEIEQLWQQKEYTAIKEHNKSCLIKEYEILQNKSKLLKLHEHKINEKGWYSE